VSRDKQYKITDGALRDKYTEFSTESFAFELSNSFTED